MNVPKILKLHPTFTSHELVKQMCEPLRQFGITYFGHGRINNDNKCTFICTNPDWASFFLTSDLGRNSLLYFKTSAPEHILLADSMPRIGKSQLILDEFYHRGYGHMMSILRTYDTHREIFHFAGSRDDYLINNRYLWHLNELKAFINFYKNTAEKDRWLRTKDELRLPIAPTGAFGLKKGYENVDCGQYYQDLQVDRNYLGDTYITKREFECLHWLAMGKTQDETGIIMNITTRTVQAHIENIKQKTKCSNQMQLGMLYHELKSQNRNTTVVS